MSETPMPGMAKPATPTPLLGPSVVVPGGVVVAPAVAAVAAATVPAATVNAAAAAASLASGNPNGGSSTSVAAAASQAEPDMKGWLLKWTNYLKGYQKRWFVLSKGVLSYYRAEHGAGSYAGGRSAAGKLSIRRRRKGPRPESKGTMMQCLRAPRSPTRLVVPTSSLPDSNSLSSNNALMKKHSKKLKKNQAEMAHTCRGTISLHGALIHTVDSCTFVISNGGTQTFHIKAANEVERQSWVTALELAKAKAIRAMESDEEEEDNTANTIPSEELNLVVRELTVRLENLKTCYDLITKHGAALQRALSELETGDDLANKTKIVSERATLFRISSNAMINACSDYLQTAQTQGHKWSKMLQHERDQKLHLEEMVEQLARQHSHLEQAATRHRPNAATSASDDEDNEFYDAQEEGGSVTQEDSSFILNIPVTTHHNHRRNSNDATGSSSEGEDGNSETQQVLVVAENLDNMDVTDRISVHSSQALTPTLANQSKVVRKRRTRVPDKPNYPLNLWSIIKNCIGKDLSKIPMPVNFNEPLSMLQRLTEDFEYSEILDKAAQAKDTCEQLAYVTAFTVSSYSTTSNRTGKPFNPLLGETYECDRTDDLGWRCINEQVSHHPPMAAQYCEGRGWRCWQEFTMTSKFRGKYIQIVPLGYAHVEFPATGNRYTWRKVTTTVHNIIVGKLWVDNHGDMEIFGERNAKGVKCHLKYLPYSYFTRDTQRRVKGVVMDSSNQVKWVVNGTWDSKIEIAPVTSTSGSTENPVYKTGNYKTAWTRRMPPPDSDRYYNFTLLACQLNEPEPGVAPTDSRLRPDQRLMEDGKWNESNQEKLRLEEGQRARRRQREAEAETAAAEGRPYPPYEPIWFGKEKEEGTDNLVHVYNGTYWDAKAKGDWSKCSTIF
ncbi:oxysterol-binding protein 2 isoform X1 [Anopheles arabiensis]|uniref:Oxysterol-binding protein n=4 Tax=gambiae species complex TaxID=44542 RepID=A0A6E8W475_ANOCL|nr:oxysterol-binding protein 2 isoform X1 [Anopheles arabiensis]XP_040239619.2 oxysterol-binding protein 2 isoform X1 [Anopheles coluzzii]XP_041781751.1 oxysterol-binding protein 2 isoform X1 [Anopheles merus]